MCIKSTLHFSSNFKENSSVYPDSSGLATSQRWPQRLPPLTDCISTCSILYSPHSHVIGIPLIFLCSLFSMALFSFLFMYAFCQYSPKIPSSET